MLKVLYVWIKFANQYFLLELDKAYGVEKDDASHEDREDRLTFIKYGELKNGLADLNILCRYSIDSAALV